MSLRARLLVAFAYTLLIVIIALEVPLAGNLKERVDSEVRADSAARAQVIAAKAVDDLGSPKKIDQLASTEASTAGGAIAIIDGHGRLIAHSSGDLPLGTRYAQAREHVLHALGGGIAQVRGPALGSDGESLLTAVPVVRNGRTRGAVELAQPVGAVDDAVREDTLALIVVGLLALTLGLVVAWILAGSIARPLRALAGVASRMSRGELSARAQLTGSSEQRDLARSFNQMAHRVEAMVESQRDFVGDASHQLRTPLTGLRLRLESAGVKSSDESVRTDIEAAERETERLDLLVTDLLALASSDEPAPRGSTDLAACVGAAVERWAPAAQQEFSTLKPSGPTDVRVAISEGDAGVVLDNLIENAIKYSPNNSAVPIEWTAGDGDEEVVLSVENAGGPLASDELERAFERFFRGATAARQAGTGLGLAIVESLVRRTGGSARLLNREANVRVEITLPTPNPESLR